MRTVFLSLCLLSAPVGADAQEPAEPGEAVAETPRAPAEADEAWRHITFGATLETYYQWNGNRPPDRVTRLRAYDTRANTFAVQQATVSWSWPPTSPPAAATGCASTCSSGQATETVQGSAANEPRPDVYRNVWQGFGSYVFPVGRGLRTDFGKFASMLGYETNYAKDDDHFSRAYLFNFLPFYHSGLRASLPVSDKRDAPLHADQRRPADGGVQRLQVATTSRRC